MHHLSRYLVVCLICLLAGCSDSGQTTVESTSPSAKVVQVAAVVDRPELTHYTFPATVTSVKNLALSFEVSGRLLDNALLTGSQVKKGDLLATLDSVPYQRRVNEKTALRDKAARELKRVKALFSRNLVAQSALDNAKTDYELAQIALLKAQQDLDYTKLYAPFDAQVSERLIDSNNLVQAGQPIATLQDMSRIYFTFNVPERLLSIYKGNPVVTARAKLVNQPGSFAIEYVEHSTAVDPVSQTYKVVFAMDPIANRNITPGARATVDIAFNNSSDLGHHRVPFSALVGASESGFKVFKVMSDNTVSLVPVEVIKVVDGYALLESDLVVGDRVVSAGASHLSDGMSVRVYQGER
ncbi:efflux RND transporter periplasmic adaptor subunit [Thalassotalea ponticola]|uniref:efflux RND transporter periplasmic adaptor subunit n=1 Tax=Thalassotalea ponticola TaxID=1523392 RepID=UPI0025B472BB|nr:efflux RND transporter periplasmic adaptor subunit [Thalassotalea ponticola]MDN3653257.1 efflux RND transporter periplasmic adaptor subunit [Thalassotalea ponticola]